METFGILKLENGVTLKGKLFGKKKNITGEIVFNTSMVGYPEALTDPSYKNQILVLTYPTIGNYGVPPDVIEYRMLKYFESNKIQISGLVIADYCKFQSHWNSFKTLSEWMEENNIPGLYDIDTRMLTKIIRNSGTMKALINYDKDILDNSDKLNFDNIKLDKNLVEMVSTKEVIEYNKEGKYKIIVIDCGIKNNIIRMLLKYDDIYLKIVPYNYKINEEYDGLFISNGPGDPKECIETIETIRNQFTKNKPIFGICLGNQLLGLAGGCDTIKLKYGNRSVNQPAIDLMTRKCYITSQNHGYAIDMDTLSEEWNPYYINANDFSNEGIIHNTKPYFGVQFHPEACAGPEDTDYLFDIFIKRVKGIETRNINKNFNYYYQIKQNNISKVLILGSGGLSIGQAGEFDYSGSQAIKALKEEGIETILINPNIATVQTSKHMADKIYYLGVNKENVTKIIENDKPDSIMINFGGQTALNCAVELYHEGLLDNIKILGTNIESIILSEDRDKFANLMESIGEPVAKRYMIQKSNIEIVNDKLLLEDEIDKAVNYIGFPMILRNGFALGGLGSCFIDNKEDLTNRIKELIKHSDNILVEQSIKGWKEVEYEIVRDYADNCIAVCNMENFDPLGIHTGDSIVVAPSQTLSNNDYYRLRKSAIKIAKRLNIVGECNVQFALNPYSNEYIIIELNPRLSRSSALASKATGYPLAYVAAKILIGKDLIDLKNKVTRKTTACYEPSLDYIVVKMPKWEFKKFKHVNKILDTSMKSVGEVMAIGRNFEETIQKAIRMVNDKNIGFFNNELSEHELTEKEIIEKLKNPSYNRLLIIASAFDIGLNVDRIYDITKINKWFLHKLYNIHLMKNKLQELKLEKNIKVLEDSNEFKDDIIQQKYISKDLIHKHSIFNNEDYGIILESKKLGFSDILISTIINCSVNDVFNFRRKYNIIPYVKQIDTTGGEFPAETNYLYLTYNGSEHDVKFNNNGIIVLGCGSYRIGSSVEFDWCAVSCINALKKNKKYTIVINYNPETVSTDYDVSDRLYFEEISVETVSDIYYLENSEGVIVSVGGQTPNNIAIDLYKKNVNILGTSPVDIDRAEDRHKFSQLLDTLHVNQPKWKELDKINEAIEFCETVKYPVLIRPSYVLSGAAMKVAENEKELISYLKIATNVSKKCPVVISKFITDAKEIEIDAVADKGKLINYAISEHVENAGVHSGDATVILPAQKVYLETTKRIKKVTKKIAESLNISGPFNIQFISKENEIKVIECNLRASRSFPFVSKTFDVNFIELATNIMINKKYNVPHIKIDDIDYVSIKVPVFSFSRLPNVDPVLGVEMVSTGEVAAFGYDVKETYIKALMASGFKLPKKNILISIGDDKFKYEFINSIRKLIEMGFNVYTTSGTFLFFKEHDIHTKQIDILEIISKIEKKEIELVINIPKNRYNSNNDTNGYIIRRKTIDNDISLMTNIKCARLFVASLKLYIKNNIEYKSWDYYLN